MDIAPLDLETIETEKNVKIINRRMESLSKM